MISNFDLLILQLSDIVQKCFVLQTELKIPPFKWDMAQPSSLFVGRDILQTILGTFFLGHPVEILLVLAKYSATWCANFLSEILEIEGKKICFRHGKSCSYARMAWVYFSKNYIDATSRHFYLFRYVIQWAFCSPKIHLRNPAFSQKVLGPILRLPETLLTFSTSV